jgi:TonB family protein
MQGQVSLSGVVLRGISIGIGLLLLTGTVLTAISSAGQSSSNETCLSSDADGRFEAAVRAAALEPSNATLQHIVATFYFQRSQDPRLDATRKHVCLDNVATAEDRALAADPTFFDALVYKTIALRTLAADEPDAAAKQRLTAEADDLRSRAVTLRNAAGTSQAEYQNSNLALPPPPPPPPPVEGAGPIQFSYAQTSFTASGNTGALQKVKDVRPVFPPVAISFGIQGTVVIEAVVDRAGRVTTARIVESVPLLDQAAIDAIKQWQFDPATVNPTNERVTLTIRANFIPPK